MREDLENEVYGGRVRQRRKTRGSGVTFPNDSQERVSQSWEQLPRRGSGQETHYLVAALPK